MRHRIVLVCCLALDLLGVAVLHTLADRPWAQLTTAAPAADAAAATIRLLALAAGWWVALTTVLYLGTRLLRAPGAGRAIGRLLFPSLRRLAEAALVVSLTVGRSVPGAAAEAVPPVLRVEVATEPDDVPPPLVAPSRDALRSQPATDEHVVRPGEHLWSIAATTVGHRAPPQVIGRYWRELVAHNRDRLRSGDPDLIFPGEVLELPPR